MSIPPRNKRILLLDNYDSFTYNLHHYVEPLVTQVDVVRNDQFLLESIDNYDAIILSPGPGLPKDAGMMPTLIEAAASKLPILGVCLGHQAIAEHFGARLFNMTQVLHGQASEGRFEANDQLFEGCENPMLIGHYHSWAVEEQGLPDCLEITMRNEHGHVMALRHKTRPIHGLQFHPESILTPQGKNLIENWVKSI